MEKYKSSIVAIVVILIVLTIVGFKILTTPDAKIGEGSNKDLSNNAFVKSQLTPELKNETFGEVLHKGVVSKDTVIQGVKLDDGITTINFISRTKPVNIVALVCESRSDTWAVAHNTYTSSGEGVTNAEYISIMNYPAGVTDIREIDESRDPVFSTANGDTNIYNALLKLQDLDPESTIAFTFEKEDSRGAAVAEGWSALFKVKDVVAGLKKVSLYDCRKASVPSDGADIQFVSNDQLRALAATKK